MFWRDTRNRVFLAQARRSFAIIYSHPVGRYACRRGYEYPRRFAARNAYRFQRDARTISLSPLLHHRISNAHAYRIHGERPEDEIRSHRRESLSTYAKNSTSLLRNLSVLSYIYIYMISPVIYIVSG